MQTPVIWETHDGCLPVLLGDVGNGTRPHQPRGCFRWVVLFSILYSNTVSYTCVSCIATNNTYYKTVSAIIILIPSTLNLYEQSRVCNYIFISWTLAYNQSWRKYYAIPVIKGLGAIHLLTILVNFLQKISYNIDTLLFRKTLFPHDCRWGHFFIYNIKGV